MKRFNTKKSGNHPNHDNGIVNIVDFSRNMSRQAATQKITHEGGTNDYAPSDNNQLNGMTTNVNFNQIEGIQTPLNDDENNAYSSEQIVNSNTSSQNQTSKPRRKILNLTKTGTLDQNGICIVNQKNKSKERMGKHLQKKISRIQKLSNK